MADETTTAAPTQEQAAPDVQVSTGKTTEKMLTQAEVDKIVEARLARDRKKWETEYQAKLEEERKKAAMSETEKLKAAKEEAEARAAKALAEANEILVRAEVKATAAEMGLVDGDAAYALVDRDSIELKDGKVKGVKEALEALVKARPWLQGERKGGPVGSGTIPAGAVKHGSDMNAFIRRAAGRG
jgi:hypothetical protein